MISFPVAFILFLTFLFGAIVGSFLNVCIYRLPLNLSLAYPPSRCPRCKMRIKYRDNIPVLGYFLLKGRCRFCASPFSIRYPLIELLTAVMATWLVWHFGLGFWSAFYFLMLSVLLVVVFVDIDHRIIPNVISIPGIFVGLVAALILPAFVPGWFVSFKSSLVGAVLGGGLLYGINFVYTLFTGRDGIGFGDVKLMAMLGAFFGAEVVLLTIFLSSLLGSVAGFAVILAAGKTSRYPIPFGPFIVAGCLLSLWLGDDIVRYFFQQ